MKYISFVVPCYNSQHYMRKCIKSLLYGKEDVEIIIVDDGSTDRTGIIADEYAAKYPTIVKAIHQSNGGHGEGINTGLKHATGKYFKVVDSDDWVDTKAYREILKRVKEIDADLIITNYVYNYSDGRDNQKISFANVFLEDVTSKWNTINRFKPTQYLSLHSLMYKKSVLDKTKIKLPKHIFYEDNLFIYLPLINTNTLFYLDVDFYQYYIGRSDQSVNENQLIKRSSHQVQVTELVCGKYKLKDVKNRKLRKYMKRECVFLATIGVVFSRLSYNEIGEQQYKEMWRNIKKSNPALYYPIRYASMATFVSFPGPLGRFIAIKGYRLAHRLVKFN